MKSIGRNDGTCQLMELSMGSGKLRAMAMFVPDDIKYGSGRGSLEECSFSFGCISVVDAKGDISRSLPQI